MTWDYEYMDRQATWDRGDGSNAEADQGPAFSSIFGRLALKRRFIRNHYVDYRTGGRPENRSGCAGAFGKYRRSYGSTTGGWRFGSVTLSNLQYQTAILGTGAVDSTPAGQIFEYLDKNMPLRRNGQGDPGISEPTTDAPEIIGDAYVWGQSQNQLNLKLMLVKEGLDYENNCQSNRICYG